MIAAKPGTPTCNCLGMQSSGDMAPSIWFCPVHGKTGFQFVRNVYDEYGEKLGVSWEWFWDITLGIIQTKRMVFKLDDMIYYVEDFLDRDLRAFCDNILKNIEKKNEG